jgi:C4-type Zn-finger protein
MPKRCIGVPNIKEKPDRPCPICGNIIHYEEGEGEFSGDILIYYEGWWCPTCSWRFSEECGEFEPGFWDA